MNSMLSVSGKPLAQTVSFRMPVQEYQHIVEIAQRNGRTLSEFVREAALAEAARFEAREARLEQLAQRTRSTAHGRGVSVLKSGGNKNE